MNGLNKFMDGLYKIIAPIVDVAFALFVTIAGNMGIQAYKGWVALGNSITDVFSDTSTKSGGTGLITFFQLIYWIIALAFIASKGLNAFHAITSNPQALNALKSAAPAQNNNAYAQPQQNFAQPVQNNIPAQQSVPTPAPAPVPVPAPAADNAPAANAAADRFCTQCGSKVPAGNSFCTSCGAKLD